jgi:tetratricopeptide (TPR) repeat protein
MSPELLALEKEAEQLKSDGKNQEAIAKFLEALAIDEDFERVHLALSVLYSKVEDHANSVVHAEKAFKISPDPINSAALSEMYRRAFEATRDPIYIEKAESVNTNLQ